MAELDRRSFLRLFGQGTAVLSMGLSGKAWAAKEKAGSGIESTKGKYQIFQPGEYLDWEKKMVDERMAFVKKGPQKEDIMTEEVNEADLLSYNRTWDPYNPLFNEKQYAQKAGYPDVPAFPCFINPRGMQVPRPPWDAGDKAYFQNDGGDTRVWTHIFPGDSFTIESENFSFVDITIPGSDLRHFRRRSSAKMYNRNGEQVGWGDGPLREAYRKIIDGSPKPSFSENNTEWVDYFPPAHYTTDEEYEYIKELWDKEYIRGSQKLYWEDVNVGDEPTWTCSGPISHMDIVAWYGGGGRGITLRNRRDQWKFMFRDRYGIYLPSTAKHYGGQNIPGFRMVFFNNTAAMHITRMITNYIGDAGLVTRIAWYFKALFREMQIEKYQGGEYLDKVHYMKGKTCTVHPSEGDTVIAKGYVTDKYINDRGEHIIDLTCWAETLDDRIIQVVAASAKLPSNKG